MSIQLFYGHITQFVKHHTCSDRKLEIWNVSLDVLINENEFSSSNYSTLKTISQLIRYFDIKTKLSVYETSFQ